jgi:hypothetical protein
MGDSMKLLRRQPRFRFLAEHIWWFTTTDTRHIHVRLNYSKRHKQMPTEFILLQRFGGRLGLGGHIPLLLPPKHKS